MSLALGLLSRIGMKVWLGAAIVGAVLAALARVKRAGVMEERARQQAREIEGGFVRRRIEVEIEGASDSYLDDMLRPPTARRLH